MPPEVAAADLDLSDVLRPNDAVVIGQACGEPTSLVEALIRQGQRVPGLSAFIATSFSGLFVPDTSSSFSLSSMGAIGALRRMAKAGKLTVIPVHNGQIGVALSSGIIPCDVAFIQVSPPGPDGAYSCGLVSDTIEEMIRQARVVIAEVNNNVPYTFGQTVAAADIDIVVRSSAMPVELAPTSPGRVDELIAVICASYIEDGSVLQIGVGALPDAVLRHLSDRRDLGMHSGVLGDALVDLVEAGVVTNSRKEIDPGVSVSCTLIGTRKLYDWADRNPLIRMMPSSYTHDATILGKLSRFVSLNSAIEVDLTGQVNSEQSGPLYLGGNGGQVDFVRAGTRSPGGHSIIALASTANGGTSKIVPVLSGPVTAARSEVDVIVTEYGAAELKGRSLADRARQLAAISHPDFREELDRAAFEIAQRGF